MPFFGRAQEAGGGEPLGERDLGQLKDGPDGHEELLTAVGAGVRGRSFLPFGSPLTVQAIGFSRPASRRRVSSDGESIRPPRRT